jgi:CRP/FNR family transcriptional regulator, cyclic AMP receptor protein
VEALEQFTVSGAGGQPLGGVGEGEFDDQHAPDGRFGGVTASVSADTSTPCASLRDVPLLAGLPAATLRELTRTAPPRQARAGSVLRHAGDPADGLLLLMRGRVAATAVSRSGRVVRHGEWSGPCALDKVAVIDGGGHTAALTALTDCTVRTLPRGVLLRLFDDAASVRHHVLRVLAGHARERQEQFAAAATMSTQARLAGWLLERAAVSGGRRVTLPGGQQTLADSLGVTRVTVTRALSGLRRDGLVDVPRRGEVVLLAPELLSLRSSGL